MFFVEIQLDTYFTIIIFHIISEIYRMRAMFGIDILIEEKKNDSHQYMYK